MRKISNIEYFLSATLLSSAFMLGKSKITEVDFPEPTPIVQRYLDMHHTFTSLNRKMFSDNPYTQNLISRIKEDIRDLRQNDPNAHEIERYIEAKEAREDAATESAYDAGLLFALLTISRGAHQIYRRAMNVPERKMNGGYHHG